MKMYVIGNGFDLAHDLKTRYPDYKNYIKSHLKNNQSWEIVLDFYPDNYEFWSDIEYNVCNINKELYFKLKRLYGSGFLDDLERQIHDSFENFILGVESEALLMEQHFQLDCNSIFLSFNYTTVLKDIYHVSEKNIVYIHNNISGPALKLIYGLSENTPCIIGHSPIKGDYNICNDKEMLCDEEYLDYINSTTKRCEENIKKRRLNKIIKDNFDKITELVFYGFSFSITDKIYIQYLFNMFSDKDISIKIFYKLENNQTESDAIALLKRKLLQAGVTNKNVVFLNCDSTKSI